MIPPLQFPVTLQAVSLATDRTRLEPLSNQHATDLLLAGKDAVIWHHLPYHHAFEELETVQAWIAGVNESVSSGDRLAFAIIDRSSGRAVGSTSYLDIRPEHRGMEIGWTWLAVSHQRTHINTECKFLLLQYAFETLGAIRVQFKTDSRNVPSRKAMERIGATFEGIARKHLALDTHIRDSAYYSITDDDWHSSVKSHLSSLMNISNINNQCHS